MLPAETCLAPLCLHFLQTRFLGEQPTPQADESKREDLCATALMVKVNNDVVHDNFYSVKAVCDQGVRVVQRGVVRVLEWRFEVLGQTLQLRIGKAEVFNLEGYPEIALTPLERNPRIRAAMHRMRFQAALRMAKDFSVNDVVELHSDSEIEEGPAPSAMHPAPPPNTPQISGEQIDPSVPEVIVIDRPTAVPEPPRIPTKRKAVIPKQPGSAFLPYKRPSLTRSSPAVSLSTERNQGRFSQEDLAFLKYYMGV